jgi:hypothetical protein
MAMARREITGKKPHATAHASGEAPPFRGPALAMSIREFCTAHRISEDMFFKMRRQGWGPAVMRVGTRTLISIEAAAEWRKAREKAATGTA